MRGKLQQFMAGRYGVDQFARFLNFFVIILLVVSMLTRQGILYLLALALMVYSYFRIFSRTRAKRYAENAVSEMQHGVYQEKLTGVRAGDVWLCDNQQRGAFF
ncbi:MAG: hypothetical protein OSJ38_03980 [Lachnospiraceae bacterium]|nr:hypothetical protein [Lachnospiraceae bacterium]